MAADSPALDHHQEYLAFAARLREALEDLGLPAPHPGTLRQAILDHFDNTDFDYVRRLLSPTDERDWRFVCWYKPTDPEEQIHQVSPSREDALAAILEGVHALNVAPSSIRPTADSLDLIGPTNPIVSTGPLPFEPEDTDLGLAISTVFHKTRECGNQPQIINALKALPHFDGLSWEFLERHPLRDPVGSAVVKSPTNLAWSVGDMLSAHGVRLTNWQALSLTARAFGGDTWDTWRMRADEPRCWLEPAQITLGPTPGPARRLFFRSPWTALGVFGKLCDLLRKHAPLAIPLAEPFLGGNGIAVAAHFICDGSNDPSWEPAATLGPVEIVCPSETYLELARSSFNGGVDAATALTRAITAKR